MSFCRDEGCQQSDLRSHSSRARARVCRRASARVSARRRVTRDGRRDPEGRPGRDQRRGASQRVLEFAFRGRLRALRGHPRGEPQRTQGQPKETHAPESFLRAVDPHSGRPAPGRVVRAVPPDAPQRRQGARLVQPEGSGVGSVRRSRARFEAARESRLPRARGLAQERLGRLRAYRLRGCAEAPARPRGPAMHGGRRQRGARRAVPKKKRRREGGDDARAGGRDGRDADALARRYHPQGPEDRVRRERDIETVPPGRRGPVQPVLRSASRLRDAGDAERAPQAAGPRTGVVGEGDDGVARARLRAGVRGDAARPAVRDRDQVRRRADTGAQGGREHVPLLHAEQQRLRAARV